ncbi:MAG: hypothetical protein KBD36_06610 [Alphaproteobacteria bacterium]|nr:hypothetical protein [Alphaproteobacteria bacterium]
MLKVITDLRDDGMFFKENHLLLYTVSQELDPKAFGEKVIAIKDLEIIGGIAIHNKGDERLPGSLIYEFQILIIQPAFDGIYKRCVTEVAKKSLEEYENQLLIQKNLPALQKKLEEFIFVQKLCGKQAALVRALNDFEPKHIDKLSDNIKTSDLADLKRRVQIKMEGSGFFIKTIRSKSFAESGLYKLMFPSNF